MGAGKPFHREIDPAGEQWPPTPLNCTGASGAFSGAEALLPLQTQVVIEDVWERELDLWPSRGVTRRGRGWSRRPRRIPQRSRPPARRWIALRFLFAGGAERHSAALQAGC